jgi:hypothetical protein
VIMRFRYTQGDKKWGEKGRIVVCFLVDSLHIMSSVLNSSCSISSVYMTI